MNWQPVDLCRCVGSVWLGWLTAILSAGMLYWYVAIALRWLDAARHSAPSGRIIWKWLIGIFIVCALAGYGSWILSLFMPKIAAILRITMLLTQNILCPVFWSLATKVRFVSIGKNEALGNKITIAVSDNLNDQELASLARQLVAASLARTS